MNDYKDKIKNMTWSYSRLSLYAQCKYAFYLKYIVDDPDQYLPEGNFYAEAGSFVHEILEMVYSGKLSADDASRYFADHFDENVCYPATPSVVDKSFESCAEYLANTDFRWLGDDYEILGVELETTQNIDGYRFIGIIDLLVRNVRSGNITIIDHKSAPYPLSKKSGKVLKNSEKSFESYKRQMYLYCRAVRDKFGEFPKHIVWNHFKSGDYVEIPFDESEYNAAIQWFVDTIHEIEDEVDYAESMDFFYCHALCDFRHSCEYANGGD